MNWMEHDLERRRQENLYRCRRRIGSSQGPHLRWQGRDYVNFASNDYLNLAADPRLARAACRAAKRYGTGGGASALVCGYLPPLQRLERDLAEWEEQEAALVFSSGFAANLAAVSAVAGPEDAIFSDALNHASLIDGCRLARAECFIYRHVDVNHLHDLLRVEGGKFRRRIIVSDTVFSMDGDLAPLRDLLDLAGRHGCTLLIDEAHATGVLGVRGGGVSDVADPMPECLIKVGTLSKGLGAQGGFVAGSRVLIDFLINHARPYIFSTALAPPTAAAARAAIRIVRDEPERRQRLLDLADTLRTGLRRLGWDVGPSCCQIVPVIVGDARVALELSDHLKSQGVLAPAIRPPSVPPNTSRLRISLTAGHRSEDVEQLLSAMGPCRVE